MTPRADGRDRRWNFFAAPGARSTGLVREAELVHGPVTLFASGQVRPEADQESVTTPFGWWKMIEWPHAVGSGAFQAKRVLVPHQDPPHRTD